VRQQVIATLGRLEDLAMMMSDLGGRMPIRQAGSSEIRG